MGSHSSVPVFRGHNNNSVKSTACARVFAWHARTHRSPIPAFLFSWLPPTHGDAILQALCAISDYEIRPKTWPRLIDAQYRMILAGKLLLRLCGSLLLVVQLHAWWYDLNIGSPMLWTPRKTLPLMRLRGGERGLLLFQPIFMLILPFLRMLF